MKFLQKICIPFLLLAMLSACGGGGGGGGGVPNVGKGNVDFVVSSAAERTRATGLSAIAAEGVGQAGPSAVISANVHNVRVVVKNAANVSTSYVLGLSNFNGAYISTQLSLEVGSYTLETYEVRDSANNVLYATPLTGSSAAAAVSAGESLPKAMTVTLAGPNQVTPQIVSTVGQTPASFGFAAFGFNLQESITFQVGAYTMTAGSPTREAATVTVTADGTTVSTFSIATPVVASITISQSANAAAVYAVTVSKSGFTSYVLGGLTAAQLRSRINGNAGGAGIIDALLAP